MEIVPVRRAPRSGFDLDEPFTPATAARAGIGRAALERLLRTGEIVRLVRGVYVGASAHLDQAARARALGLVVSPRHLVVDRTAAWVHGAPPPRARPNGPIPVDLHGRRRFPGGPVPVAAEEVSLVGGLRCTSPLRTALDVARHFAPERALPLLDGMLRTSTVTHGELLAAGPSSRRWPGSARALELTAIADGRALDAAESVLRLRWLEAPLPTPAPGWEVLGVRLALALPEHRYGVVLAGEADVEQRLRVAAEGWRVVVLERPRILTGDPDALAGHLVREFHRHLLDQMA